MYRNYVYGGINFLLAKRLWKSKATVILCFLWIRIILDQFFFWQLILYFHFSFSECYLLSVLKGWQNGLQYIRKDGLDCGEEEVISSCLRNLKENICGTRKPTRHMSNIDRAIEVLTIRVTWKVRWASVSCSHFSPETLVAKFKCSPVTIFLSSSSVKNCTV